MRDANPQITFADLEFQSQGIQLDPVLEQILNLICQNSALLEAVEKQLEHGLKKPKTGRHGLSAKQVLLSLILMRIKDWDYRELRERIADGYTLRQFTQFYSNPVPKHDAFNRAHNRLTSETVTRANDLAVEAAVAAGLEDGTKLRADTMVVESNIHWPTDATLLWDTVRVLTRLIGRVREMVPKDVPKFPNRKRSARKRMQKLQRMAAAQREKQQRSTYRELLGITEEVLRNTRRVIEATQRSRPKTPSDILALGALRKEMKNYCGLADRVIDQAHRRVIHGEQVPSSEKIYSIFEPHTDLIKRGKANKPVEFGHKVFLAESANGLITQYAVLKGNPSDADHVAGCLTQHQTTFGSTPELLATDRGFDSQDNQNSGTDAGVACLCIPQRGGKKTPERETFEKSAAFKQGQRFRAGIEGTISVLMRGRGMRRCRDKGEARFEVLVGAAVLANNLMRIAQLLLKKHKPRKRAA